MAKVLWQRLILRGFGRYRDEVTIDLVNNPVLVLPNEAGKSTLVAGLAAVIFGLPATSDPSKFGQARYRNWYDPPEFSGELHFSVGSTEYHLTRNFASHQVSLSYYAQGQWVQLPQATGIDNPSATRPFRKYQETLQQLLGISSLDLFLATFCLTQPLPTPEGLDDAVQNLLAGAGSKATKVQQFLENQLRQITRYYGEPLGRTRGGNKDRHLEELRAQIDDLTQQIAAGQDSSAELQVLQARLASLQQERQLKQELLAKCSGALQAWSEWRTLAERYQHGLEQQQQVEQALHRARQLEEQAEEVGRQLEAYALFVNHSLDWAQLLEQQLERQRELERGQQELEELRAELALYRTSEERKHREYQAREQELVAAAGEAQEQYAALVTKDDTYNELQQDYQARFGDLPIEPAQLLVAMQQRDQSPVAGRRRQKPASGGVPAWVSRLGGMALGALSYLFWGRTAGAWGLLVCLACCLLGWLLPLVGGRGGLAIEQDPIDKALARCADLKATQTFLEKLLAAEAARPAPIELAQAQARVTQAEAELASWRRMLSDFGQLEVSSRSSIERRVGEHQAYMEELQRGLAAAAEQVRALGGPSVVLWPDLWQEYQAYGQLEQKRREIRQAQSVLYSAQQVADFAGLELRALDLQNRVAAVRLAWQALVDNNPGLPSPVDYVVLGPRDMHRSAPLGRPQDPQEQYDQLRAHVEALQQELATLQHEEEDLLRRRAQLEGQKPLNLAIAYEQLQELNQQEELLSLEVDALGLAYRELEAARVEYSANHRERLAGQVNNYFSQITGQAQRRVELDSDFAVGLRGEKGQPIHPAQLSQGARDQLYLSLRLAIADLLAEDVRLPFILDDPFVNCDSERLERIRQALLKVAESRQIWLLTHNPALSNLLTP